MNTKIKMALGLAFTALTFSANAQKKYTEGIITSSVNVMGQPVEAKTYFTTDSTAIAFQAGPAAVRILSSNKGDFMATLVDVPIASKKFAAVATPAEVEENLSKIPTFTFAPTTETKVINGFNCKKVVATDAKANKTYDFWVTNDISIPPSPMSKIYNGAGGFPIQYYSFRDGQAAQVSVKSITEGKAPAGTFAIQKDFEKITMEQLDSMRHQ
ncbi:hypothetical protein FO440_13995 [Mucilaginibacter corticis]|uniref:DUF4412 domain-containing protein n=1 Tax=Mucilaginibacter corticis TaxID=2597670 RepID=A0A556MLP1_9SPHI|nr:hypothetical protein [Mucilaginibacter corticis]TSJ40847.1 hypothetical protein FO440_13995 [Mucilaginibacter corticis]